MPFASQGSRYTFRVSPTQVSATAISTTRCSSCRTAVPGECIISDHVSCHRQKVSGLEQEVSCDSPPPQQSTWEPPVSPFGLIEEQVFHNPWKVFLACLLLNRTSATQVRKSTG